MLSHDIQNLLNRGVAGECAEVARRLDLTRARLAQLIDLTFLAPETQESILFLEAVDGVERMSKKKVRVMVSRPLWAGQQTLWGDLAIDRGGSMG